MSLPLAPNDADANNPPIEGVSQRDIDHDDPEPHSSEFDPGSDAGGEGDISPAPSAPGSYSAQSWADQVEEDRDLEYYRKRALELGSGDVTLDAVLSHLGGVASQRHPDDSNASVAKVYHSFDNFNRSIEAVLGTDALLLDNSCAYLRGEQRASVHTRMFEAVGDYIPNLILRDQQTLIAITPKWVNVTARTDSHWLVDIDAPLRRGVARYRLVNGKFADLRVGKKTPPPFVNFPPFAGLANFRCYGILASLEKAVLMTVPRGPLLTPAELFDAAITRAGGVSRVALLPYHSLHPDALQGSKHFTAWLQHSLAPEAVITPPPATSYRDALLQTLDELKKCDLDDEGDRLRTLLCGMITVDITEEEAEHVYLQTMSYLPSASVTDPSSEPGNTGLVLQISDQHSDDKWLTTTLPLMVSGEELLVEAKLSERQIEMPYPAFLVPDSSGPSAAAILARQVTLGKRVKANIAQFRAQLPWYALSVTPRNQDSKRGIMSDGATWYERMHADVNFHGPFFSAPAGDEVAQRWANIFNTTWMEELLARGKLRSEIEIWRWAGEPGGPEVASIPLHARGIGVAQGRLCLSPLVEVRDKWRDANVLDSRARFPREVLDMIIDHGEIFSVKNAQDYLNHQAPLRIVATINGVSHERFYSDGLTLNPNATSAELAFVGDSQSVTTTDEGGVPLKAPHSRQRSFPGKSAVPLQLAPQRSPPATATPPIGGIAAALGAPVAAPSNTGWAAPKSSAPTLPAPSKKVSETLPREWGIPEDETAPGWQAKVPPSKVPFSEVRTFSSKIVVANPGNWNSIGPQLMNGGVSKEVVNNHYSVHWYAANGDAIHPVVQYHNPVWVESLKGKPLIRERWHWPTSRLAPHPWLSTNGSGQEALYGTDAARHEKKLHQHPTIPRGRGGGVAPRGIRGRGGLSSTNSGRSNWPSPAASAQPDISGWGETNSPDVPTNYNW